VHLNQKGLEELVSLKASSNLGLSTKLKMSFPHIIPAPRTEIKNKIMPDLYWFVGFTNGDGSFAIRKSKNSTLRHGYQYSLSFEVSQHSRDIDLFKSLKDYFGCGKVIKDTKQERCRFFVTDSKDNQTKIIPIFKKYSMLGFKQLDFQDFCKGAEIIASKGHLTEEGIKKLDEIRGGMNERRAWIEEK
jgi:LAGLIDADG endonuclease